MSDQEQNQVMIGVDVGVVKGREVIEYGRDGMSVYILGPAVEGRGWGFRWTWRDIVLYQEHDGRIDQATAEAVAATILSRYAQAAADMTIGWLVTFHAGMFGLPMDRMLPAATELAAVLVVAAAAHRPDIGDGLAIESQYSKTVNLNGRIDESVVVAHESVSIEVSRSAITDCYGFVIRQGIRTAVASSWDYLSMGYAVAGVLEWAAMYAANEVQDDGFGRDLAEAVLKLNAAKPSVEL
jgi:hypothetical protein